MQTKCGRGAFSDGTLFCEPSTNGIQTLSDAEQPKVLVIRRDFDSRIIPSAVIFHCEHKPLVCIDRQRNDCTVNPSMLHHIDQQLSYAPIQEDGLMLSKIERLWIEAEINCEAVVFRHIVRKPTYRGL